MKEKRELESVVSDVVDLLEEARRASARSINRILTSTYWEIGRRIVEEEQRGGARAEHYGEEVVDALAKALSARFGRGFGRRNLFLMRAFFVAFRDRGEIVQAVPAQSPQPTDTQEEIVSAVPTQSPRKGRRSARSGGSEIVQAAPGQSFAPAFPLPWTHYVELLSLDNAEARTFYETEALRGGWSYRQLHRQIATRYFERTALKKKIPTPKLPPEGPASVEEEVKDPYVLEFLGLKDEYSENDMEDALIHHLESFLLELGGDFAFVARQRNCRIGDEWYRVDLLLFHRRLRCLIVIDLKLDGFTARDVGQVNMYVNYARQHWKLPDENPPVGLILSAKHDAAVAAYALDGLENKIVSAEYRTVLPDEQRLVDELNKTRRLLEARRSRTKP